MVNLCAPAYMAAVWGEMATCMKSSSRPTTIKSRSDSDGCRTWAHAIPSMTVIWARAQSATPPRCAWSRSAHLATTIKMIWARYTRATFLLSKNSNLSKIKFRKKNAKSWSLPISGKKRTLLGRRTIAGLKPNRQPHPERNIQLTRTIHLNTHMKPQLSCHRC